MSLENDFLITEIVRAIYVSAGEYPEAVTDFGKTNSHTRANELTFQLSGEHDILYNNKWLHLKENSIFLLPEGEIKNYRLERKVPGDFIIIYFHADRPISEEAFCLESENFLKLRSLFQKAFALWSGKTEGYYFRCMSIAYEIIAQMQRQIYTPSRLQKLLEPAIEEIMQKNTEEVISVAHLAEICGISIAYFNRIFCKCYGMSPKKYIIHKKIESAAELLSAEIFSITVISRKLGFANTGHFSRVFKNEMGITPTEYQKKCKFSK